MADAERYIRIASAIEPHNADILSYLGVILALQSRHDESLAASQSATEIDPANSDVAGSLAAVLNFSGDYERAEKVARRAMGLTPQPPCWLYNVLGFSLLAANHHRESIAEFQKCIAMSPRWNSPHAHLITAFVELGELDSARESARSLLELEPQLTPDRLWPEFTAFRDRTYPERASNALRIALSENH